MIRNISVGIDIGTGTVRVVVGEFLKGEKDPKVIGIGESESLGCRHGYVSSINEASDSIAKAVSLAEKSSGIKIKRAYVSMGSVTMRGEIAIGSAIVSKADNEVTSLDVHKALEEAEENLNLNNKKIIQGFPIAFKLDGKEVLGRVEGLRGTKLEVKALFITCSSQHLEDLLEAVAEAGIDTIDVIASPVATASLALSKKQKMVGSMLVDVGLETTSIIIFENENPVYLYTFPIGGSDFTNDIALGLKINLEEAEALKIGNSQLSVSKKKLDEIIEARFSDIFELIDNHLKKIKRSELLPAGVIFSGGGANTLGLEEMSRNALKLPSKIATTEMFGNAKTKLRDPAWLTALGLIQSPKNTEGYTEGTFANFVKDLKQVLRSVTKQLMP